MTRITQILNTSVGVIPACSGISYWQRSYQRRTIPTLHWPARHECSVSYRRTNQCCSDGHEWDRILDLIQKKRESVRAQEQSRREESMSSEQDRAARIATEETLRIERAAQLEERIAAEDKINNLRADLARSRGGS